MSYSVRTFLVGPDERLYRLETGKFSWMLRFDEEGRLDRSEFLRQNAASAELAMGRVLRQSVAPGEPILAASSRFVAPGSLRGRWSGKSGVPRWAASGCSVGAYLIGGLGAASGGG